METPEEISKGIFVIRDTLFTKDITPDYNAFNEKRIKINGETFREWNPYRSKLAAAFKKDTQLKFEPNSIILYLGSAEGQTTLHISDIVGKEGIIFCIDISEIAMQKLAKLAEIRENIFPILSDANKIENYKDDVEEVDVLFEDVSQRNQTEIFLKNSILLKKGGYGALSLKTKSISQKDKKEILKEEKAKLTQVFDILQIVSLEPYEKEHYLILVKKK